MKELFKDNYSKNISSRKLEENDFGDMKCLENLITVQLRGNTLVSLAPTLNKKNELIKTTFWRKKRLLSIDWMWMIFFSNFTTKPL